tara:strand:- start:1433 stop:1816 length:384 start_codon:yes stop_codon:yes gene_type:complete
MDKFYTNDVKLNKNETDALKDMNTNANLTNIEKRERNDIMNMSVKKIFYLWSNTNIQIFTELVNFFSEIDKYYGFFDNIDETRQWYNGILLILRDLLNIFIKKDRAIFVGISFILLSFGLYLIQITS